MVLLYHYTLTRTTKAVRLTAGGLRPSLCVSGVGVVILHVMGVDGSLDEWPLTLKFDRATWPFLKFDRRH